MDFTESENQKAIRATVRDFAQREILPPCIGVGGEGIKLDP